MDAKLNNSSAPHVDALIKRLQLLPTALDEKAKDLTLKLFEKMRSMVVCGDNERRELWIIAERGSIEEFGDFEEYLSVGDVVSYEEFEALWLLEYPESHKWYQLATINVDDSYLVFLNGKLTLQITPEIQNDITRDQSELVIWLLLAVDCCLNMLEEGKYNAFVREYLPYEKRVGKILRKDYWHTFPEEKVAHQKDIASDEIHRFSKLMQTQPSDSPEARLPEMTAGLFFDCCRLGYEANHYASTEDLSPRELYRAHADGRDDGLLTLKEDSADDFAAWYHDRAKRIGHPWEVCRGGNSTHISLYAMLDERGWWLTLAGSSEVRSVETIKFYLALTTHGLPVFLQDGLELAAMLTGQDSIGIVPENVLPRYCGHLFPGERILSFVNLPLESRDSIVNAVTWQPLNDVKLST